jgi:serine phosphatase RsbU (regulator of sigma subunit)/CheY-like chemotaxis protein/anti-sigma regulatory factor (Ser/Thr protein kinase)
MTPTAPRRPTVLVVDDVEAHRYVVGTWLRRAGYDVVEAATGAEALHAADTAEIDIVTLDVNLPDMSGMEVCERIKSSEHTAALPILHLSGTAVDAADRNEGLRRGADAYLVEPVESDELLATVNALLRYSAARRRAVRIAGYLRRLHSATLAITTATSPAALVSAVAEGTSAIFEESAAAAMTIGTRSLVATAEPGSPALSSSCPPTLPLEAAAAVAADGAVAVGTLTGVLVAPGVAHYLGAAVTERAGGVLGAVMVAEREAPASEDADEVQVVLDQLAHAVSVSVDNLRAFELEHRISLTLQRSLLPSLTPAPAGLDVAFRYEAAADHTEVGGDFYELIEIDHDQVLAAVGDVVGHSLQAAIVMAQLRNGLRAYSLDGHEPTAILERLDRLLRRFHPTITATMCIALIDRSARRATVANAGHIAPLLLRAGWAEFVEPHGPLLGMGFRAPKPVVVDLRPADTLLLVTDGLVERRSEIIDVGLDRLVDVASRWRGSLDQLCDQLLHDVGPGSDAADDIALLAIRLDRDDRRHAEVPSLVHVGGAGAPAGAPGDDAMTERHRGASFERNSREIARARGFVSDALRTWGLAADAATFELMVSELVSNAIVHGSGDISVAVSCVAGTLRLEVGDDGGTSEPHLESKAVGGWGLHFVDELADSWGSQRHDGRTVVWALKRVSQP